MTSLRRRRIAAAIALMPFAGRALAQTPSCGAATVRQTAGPFFKPDSPEKKNLRESGAKGRLLVVSGLVLSPQCRPVANALLDFWHADEDGEYDNAGFRYRGHQFTDAQGRWRLETIVPAEYPGRTRHLHVNVQAPRGRILTTQLYFPGDAGNSRDGLYRPELTMKMGAPGEGRFDFVVAS